MPSISKSKRKPRSSTPVDSKRLELMEQENLVAAQIDALKRKIADAPRVAAEQQRREREAMRVAGTGPYRHSVLLDKRHTDTGRGRARTTPMLREERRAARRQSLVLLVALGALAAWAASILL